MSFPRSSSEHVATAVVAMSIEDAEDFILSYAQEFVALRLSARKAYRSGRSVSLDDL